MTFFLTYFLPFVVALTLLVFIHELGHYIPARRNGVRVEVFSIGFGPEIFGFNDKHGTRWKFSLIPLGGYVKMLGDANAASAPDAKKLKAMSKDELSETLHSKTAFQRMAISVGGPLANFLFAIIAMIFLFILKGHPTIPTKIFEVKPETIAAEMRLQSGDEIVAFNHKPVKTFEQLRKEITAFEGKELAIDVKRSGSDTVLTLSLKKEEGFKKPFQLGIVPDAPVFEKKGVMESVVASFTLTYQMTADLVVSLGQTLTGKKKAGDFGGILAIGDMAGKSAQASLASFVWFLIVLSINLGLLNLFPLPMLDGGAIVFCAIEAVIGRPVPHKIQEYMYLVGFGLILSLILYVTWNDLMRYGVVAKVLSVFGF